MSREYNKHDREEVITVPEGYVVKDIISERDWKSKNISRVIVVFEPDAELRGAKAVEEALLEVDCFLEDGSLEWND